MKWWPAGVGPGQRRRSRQHPGRRREATPRLIGTDVLHHCFLALDFVHVSIDS